jgi:hypothetical protein
MIFILKKYRYGFSGNYKIEDDFTLIRFQNDGIENFNAQREVSSGLIQFHFGLKGSQFILQPRELRFGTKRRKSLLLYNPQKELPLNLELAPNSMISVISIKNSTCSRARQIILLF